MNRIDVTVTFKDKLRLKNLKSRFKSVATVPWKI